MYGALDEDECYRILTRDVFRAVMNVIWLFSVGKSLPTSLENKGSCAP